MNTIEDHQISDNYLLELLCQDSIPGDTILQDEEPPRFYSIPVELMPRLFLLYAIYHQVELFFDNDIVDDLDLFYWDDDDFTDHELVLRIYSYGEFGDEDGDFNYDEYETCCLLNKMVQKVADILAKHRRYVGYRELYKRLQAIPAEDFNHEYPMALGLLLACHEAVHKHAEWVDLLAKDAPLPGSFRHVMLPLKSGTKSNPSIVNVPAWRLFALDTPIFSAMNMSEDSACRLIRISDFNIRAAAVLANTGGGISTSTISLRKKAMDVNIYDGSQPLLVIEKKQNSQVFFLHMGNSPLLAVQGEAIVLRFTSDHFLPEYICLQRLSLEGKHITSFAMSASQVLSLNYSLEQQEIEVREVREVFLHRLQEEKDAVAQREKFLSSRADLIHILSPQLTKIANNLEIIKSKLRGMESDDVNNAIRRMSDQLDFVYRITDSEIKPPDECVFQHTEVHIVPFIEQYITSWRNCGGSIYMDITLNNYIDIDTIVEIDPNQTILQMDAIFDNAKRHGFVKDRHFVEKETGQSGGRNLMQLTLQRVVWDDRAWVLLSIANNGRPLPDDMSPEDFASKGRFSQETGRSGLGGYHIYTIAKANKGHISVRRSEEWNFIIDIMMFTPEQAGIRGLDTYNHSIIQL